MKLNCKKNCKIIDFVAYFSKIYGYISKKQKMHCIRKHSAFLLKSNF